MNYSSTNYMNVSETTLNKKNRLQKRKYNVTLILLTKQIGLYTIYIYMHIDKTHFKKQKNDQHQI